MENAIGYKTHKVHEVTDELIHSIIKTYARLHHRFWHANDQPTPAMLSQVAPFDYGIGALSMYALDI